VVNNVIPGIYAWFAPGIIGGFFIRYWIEKLKQKSHTKLEQETA